MLHSTDLMSNKQKNQRIQTELVSLLNIIIFLQQIKEILKKHWHVLQAEPPLEENPHPFSHSGEHPQLKPLPCAKI